MRRDVWAEVTYVWIILATNAWNFLVFRTSDRRRYPRDHGWVDGSLMSRAVFCELSDGEGVYCNDL